MYKILYKKYLFFSELPNTSSIPSSDRIGCTSFIASFLFTILNNLFKINVLNVTYFLLGLEYPLYSVKSVVLSKVNVTLYVFCYIQNYLLKKIITLKNFKPFKDYTALRRIGNQYSVTFSISIILMAF